MKRLTEMKRTGMKSGKALVPKPFKTATPKAKKAPARKATLKTRQLAVTAEEKRFWDRMAKEIGCVACMKDGYFNPHVSIHHIDGRTKPGCHWLVLPLCGPHHQHDDTDPAGRTGVHPWSARFEKKYGTQHELLAQCMKLLEIHA